MRMSEEHSLSVNKYEEEIDELHSSLSSLEHKYHDRPSRREDIERIEMLERECEDHVIQRKKAMEEMKLYKLELINREDSYNKTFARSPVVGVMNVVGGNGSGGRDKRQSGGGVNNRGSMRKRASQNSNFGFPPLSSSQSNMSMISTTSSRRKSNREGF